LIEIAVGIGVTFSLVFNEVFGLAAGGIVVPGYIALNFHKPWMLAGTLIVAILTWVAIRIISQFVFVYGRRRMVLAVLLGFLLGYLSRQLWSGSIGDVRLEAIGYIIPGLIANWMERQGVYKTITTLLMSGAAVRLITILVMGGRLIGHV
jgi:gamma-polyglutamate biosynthesis protein CapC